MKKLFTLSITILMALCMWSCREDDNTEQLLEFYQLPQPAQAFINDYFPISVTHIARDGERAGTLYQVTMANGFKLEFDALGNWVEVDAPARQIIPDGIAPQPIISYVQVNYPSAGINGIARDYRGYEIQTTNGMDLVFDSQGYFTGYNM